MNPGGKSNQVQQQWQEINDVPKSKWLPYTKSEIHTVGLLFRSFLSFKISFISLEI